MPTRTREEARYDLAQALDATKQIRAWTPEEVADELRSMLPPQSLRRWDGAEDPEVYRRYLESQVTFRPEAWEVAAAHPGYLIPTTTGPWWVIGPEDLVVEAVGRASLALRRGDGGLVAVRPQGTAIPDLSPDRWWRWIGSAMRGRAGILWTPAEKKSRR